MRCCNLPPKIDNYSPFFFITLRLHRTEQFPWLTKLGKDPGHRQEKWIFDAVQTFLTKGASYNVKPTFPQESPVGLIDVALHRVSALSIIINVQPKDLILYVQINDTVRPITVKTGHMFVGARDLPCGHTYYEHTSACICVTLTSAASI
jgi:hypothetical protein